MEHGGLETLAVAGGLNCCDEYKAGVANRTESTAYRTEYTNHHRQQNGGEDLRVHGRERSSTIDPYVIAPQAIRMFREAN